MLLVVVMVENKGKKDEGEKEGSLKIIKKKHNNRISSLFSGEVKGEKDRKNLKIFFSSQKLNFSFFFTFRSPEAKQKNTTSSGSNLLIPKRIFV